MFDIKPTQPDLPESKVNALKSAVPFSDQSRLHELAHGPTTVGAPKERSVLIAGFTKDLSQKTSQSFLDGSWNVCIAYTAKEIQFAFSLSDYDLVLLDVDNIDQYAPLVLDQLRRMETDKQPAHLVAVSQYFVPGFARQLINCGVDELLRYCGKEAALSYA